MNYTTKEDIKGMENKNPQKKNTVHIAVYSIVLSKVPEFYKLDFHINNEFIETEVWKSQDKIVDLLKQAGVASYATYKTAIRWPEVPSDPFVTFLVDAPQAWFWNGLKGIKNQEADRADALRYVATTNDKTPPQEKL